jgi:RecA-family ATPase
VDEMGINLAGVELALDILQQLMALRGHLLVLEAEDVRTRLLNTLDDCLRRMGVSPSVHG